MTRRVAGGVQERSGYCMTYSFYSLLEWGIREGESPSVHCGRAKPREVNESRVACCEGRGHFHSPNIHTQRCGHTLSKPRAKHRGKKVLTTAPCTHNRRTQRSSRCCHNRGGGHSAGHTARAGMAARMARASARQFEHVGFNTNNAASGCGGHGSWAGWP